MNHSEIVSFLWGVADLIRDTFKRGKYQDVILPLTVLRRLDCVLAPTQEKVRAKAEQLKGEIDNPHRLLCRASGYAFYNTSRYDFAKLLADPPGLAANLRNYMYGFSPNMREVLEKFDFENTITKLESAGLLYKVLERFKEIDLHPDRVPNTMMGTIFEELLRKFNEALNENPGEHFTPRDVVHLMVDLLLAGEAARLRKPGKVVTICDPCCGTGGMLTLTKEHLLGTEGRKGIAPGAKVYLFGQEVNPETFAICKSDFFMTSADAQRDAENILFGSTLADDRHGGRHFDYLIANPPYGKDWKRDEDDVKAEHATGGRFAAGLPRISDGQLLFLQHMLSHMHPVSEGGARVAIIMNGSPLFTGDAGSGESEIRRWVLENDWLEALVALPEQLFYNTGIATYVWMLSNRKAAERRGKVLLVDATSFWVPMRKSLGDKRREVPAERAAEILEMVEAFEDGEHCKVFPVERFGFRKVVVERPLRLNFSFAPERVERVAEEKAFARLATSRKKGAAGEAEVEMGKDLQESILQALTDAGEGVVGQVWKDREAFLKMFEAIFFDVRVKLSASVKKAVLNALSERDETAEVCRDQKGRVEADSQLRDSEAVPLEEDVGAFFEREVLAHVSDAWIQEAYRDEKDGEIGKVGYEINFNRYFYEYVPPRPLEVIEGEIREFEGEIVAMLREVAG